MIDPSEDSAILHQAVRILSNRIQHRETAVEQMRVAIDCISQEINKTTQSTQQLNALGSSKSFRIRRDLFFGMRLSTAVQKDLQMRREPLDVDEILRDLKDGGFAIATLGANEEQQLAHLDLTLWKNTKTFHRLPNGAFGLLAWYRRILDQTGRRKRNRKKRGLLEGV